MTDEDYIKYLKERVSWLEAEADDIELEAFPEDRVGVALAELMRDRADLYKDWIKDEKAQAKPRLEVVK